MMKLISLPEKKCTYILSFITVEQGGEERLCPPCTFGKFRIYVF